MAESEDEGTTDCPPAEDIAISEGKEEKVAAEDGSADKEGGISEGGEEGQAAEGEEDMNENKDPSATAGAEGEDAGATGGADNVVDAQDNAVDAQPQASEVQSTEEPHVRESNALAVTETASLSGPSTAEGEEGENREVSESAGDEVSGAGVESADVEAPVDGGDEVEGGGDGGEVGGVEVGGGDVGGSDVGDATADSGEPVEAAEVGGAGVDSGVDGGDVGGSGFGEDNVNVSAEEDAVNTTVDSQDGDKLGINVSGEGDAAAGSSQPGESATKKRPPGRPKGAKDSRPRTRRRKAEISAIRNATAAGMPAGMGMGFPHHQVFPHHMGHDMQLHGMDMSHGYARPGFQNLRNMWGGGGGQDQSMDGAAAAAAAAAHPMSYKAMTDPSGRGGMPQGDGGMWSRPMSHVTSSFGDSSHMNTMYGGVDPYGFQGRAAPSMYSDYDARYSQPYGMSPMVMAGGGGGGMGMKQGGGGGPQAYGGHGGIGRSAYGVATSQTRVGLPDDSNDLGGDSQVRVRFSLLGCEMCGERWREKHVAG